ncbi:MAG: serine--tRNA ligase, partial [Enterovirga sp.]|nr:serine--tRNA ligase [Enterovirga sp.]
MHDIRLIRDDPQAFDRGLASRGLAPLSAELIALDEERRAAIADLQVAQERRNALSKDIGLAKKARDEARAAELMTEVARLKAIIPEGEQREKAANAALETRLAEIPNIPAPEVPLGPDETGNVVRHEWGVPVALANPKQHFELAEAWRVDNGTAMDFEAAARLSGSRFVVLRGQLARLERALGQFMLDLHTTEHGYTEVSPPLMVRDEVAYGTSQLPKSAEDMFRTNFGHWLIPTAEVPLTNLVRDSILAEEELPLRFTALTPCFRAEAGAAGRDTRGMLRQHQFSKCELVSIVAPEKSA